MSNSKMRKIALLLFGVAIIGSAFCGGTQDAASNRASSMEPGPYGKYDPPIEVTFVANTSDDALGSVLRNNMTFEDNLWLDMYRDLLGIDIKYKWITKSGEEYSQKLNLSIAVGDIPDIMNLGHPPVDIKRLYEAGQLQPLDDVYPKYASKALIEDVYQYSSEASFKSVTFDGELYAIPRTWELAGEGHTAFIWTRKDWMDNLGISVPKTMDDVLAMARAFNEDDPDGNGVDDTYGLLLHKNLFYAGAADIVPFFNAYGAYPDIWVDRGGKLVYGSVMPEMKKPLSILRQAFKEGVIDQEFGTRPWGNMPQELSAGRVGMLFGAQWISLWPLYDTTVDDPNVDWLPLIVPSADEKPLRISAAPGHAGYFAVNKDFAYPEALVKIMNAYWDKYYLESAEYAYPQDIEGGTWGAWALSPITLHRPGFNYNVHLEIEKAYNENKFDHMTGELLDMFSLVDSYLKGNREDWGWAKIFGPGEPGETSQAGVHYYVENNVFLEDKFLGVPPESMTDKWGSLEALQEETFIKIINGDYDLDYFDEFVDQWNKLGGAKVTEDVNEWYKTQ